MARATKILLLLGIEFGYSRNILRGVMGYAQMRPDWIFQLRTRVGRNWEMLSDQLPAGAIAHVRDPEMAEGLRQLKIPVVNISNMLPKSDFPRVAVDDMAVGAAAAEYLLARGYRSFGFVGYAKHRYSENRLASFRSALHERGFSCNDFADSWVPPRPNSPASATARPPSAASLRRDEKVQLWLQTLPRPVAIFAANDLAAFHLVSLIHAANLRIPEDVAVLGVDDDDLLCDLSRPRLSSVAPASERIGYEAARTLEYLLTGHSVNPELLLPPLGVVSRRSTEAWVTPDRDIAAAMRYIHQHAHEAIGVEDILKHIPLSRRVLERRFRKMFGRSPAEEIRRARTTRASNLLVDTDLTLAAIAKRCGFTSAHHLISSFKTEIGLTPAAYRRALQIPSRPERT